MKNVSLAAVALVLLIVAGAVWLVLNFEYATESQYVGLQGEARRNPLLAAMRLYERMGVPARAVRRVGELEALEPGATLILLRSRAALTQRHAEQLLDWVGAGGHLIVEPQDHRVRDRLLDALSIHRRPLRAQPPRKPSEFRLPHSPATLRVDFGPRQHFIDIEKRAVLTVDEHWSVLLQRFPLGRGHVTVVNGLSFMTNRRVGELDHAAFAWELVRFHPATPAVALAARLETPSLATWVRESAWPAAVTGALLLLLWLWRVVPRFGPLRADPPAARPRLLDHIRASGRFHWASGSGEPLLAAAREACLRAVARNHPGLAAMAPRAQVARLAEMTALPAAELELALHYAPGDAREFAAAIGTLQTIGDRLNRKVRTRT
jgi:hypothetical protein